MTRNERRKQLRERYALTICVAILVIFCTAITVYADANKPKIGVPIDSEYLQYFTYVYVGSGDTVSSIYYDICEMYPETAEYWTLDDYIANVRFINHLDYKSTIYYGENLAVPYLKRKPN